MYLLNDQCDSISPTKRYDPQHPGHGAQLTNAQIYDVLPTLLTRYGIEAPAGLRGKVLAL